MFIFINSLTVYYRFVIVSINGNGLRVVLSLHASTFGINFRLN